MSFVKNRFGRGRERGVQEVEGHGHSQRQQRFLAILWELKKSAGC
jgi:hypothetical protein